MEYPIRLEKVSVGYGKKKIMENIDFSLREGEILSLIGPNGAGKTTLLKSIAKQLPTLTGTVFVTGKALRESSESELARSLAIVTTARPSSEWLTCGEMAAMGRYPYTGRFGTLSAADRALVDDVMKKTHFFDLKDRLFKELSDGQKQRVLLARALCQEPRVLIMDEPTAYLDINYKLEFFSIVREFTAKQRLCVLLSLHETKFARAVSDYVLSVREGAADRYGRPDEVFTEGYLDELFGISEALRDFARRTGISY